MKRLLSLALSGALLAALTLPASAAGAHDVRLAQVTQAVKTVLELDTDAYETFRGNLSEDLVPVWNLSWEGDRRSLSVTALEDGTVASLSRWEYDPSPDSSWDSFPVFPQKTGDTDRAAAEAFLARVLREGEAAELQDSEGGLSLRGSGGSWSGTIILNGLPSPLHYSIQAENGLVTHFDRDLPEVSVVGGVPDPDASADAAKAQKDLNETLKLQLQYVWEEDGGNRAVLRYVPEAGAHEFLVDARTGELLDMTELEEQQGYRSAAGGGNGAAPAATTAETPADEAGFTQAELEGVQELEGVLSKEALDEALRAESVYGLRGYALIRASYENLIGKDGKEDQILCTLRYARTDGGERLTRNLTVNAKTGAVESVQSSAPWGREQKITQETAQKKAEAFLKALCPDRKLALCDAGVSAVPLAGRQEAAPYYRFRFARTVNGLPFLENCYWVSIDAADGSVYGLSSTWDEKVTFDNADGLVSMETALSAWAGAYETVLAYRNVPQKLDGTDPVQAGLVEQGMEYYYGLRLTYGLECKDSYEGVDARTGKPVREEKSVWRSSLAYTDISGSSARADIEKLAKYGVGYKSDTFLPDKSITQWELVALVSSLRGMAVDPGTVEKDARDSMYYDVCRMGLLRASERDDDAVLSRSDVVRMLLDAAGYGPAARLDSGIFACNYSDRGSIPEKDMGYAAIAQALDMAEGVYAGERPAARGETASMLCRVLERKS